MVVGGFGNHHQFGRKLFTFPWANGILIGVSIALTEPPWGIKCVETEFLFRVHVSASLPRGVPCWEFIPCGLLGLQTSHARDLFEPRQFKSDG